MEARGYYVSREAAHDALASATMFNVIDPNSGWKADLIIRKARPFSEAEFARRETRELLGMSIAVSRVEDLIIAKLEWASLGGSSRPVSYTHLVAGVRGPLVLTAVLTGKGRQGDALRGATDAVLDLDVDALATGGTRPPVEAYEDVHRVGDEGMAPAIAA